MGPLAHLAPHPQSKATAREFQGLTLLSRQHLPPRMKGHRASAEVAIEELEKAASGLGRPITSEEASGIARADRKLRRSQN